MGEGRELAMVLAVSRAKVSQREIAIAYWGLDEVVKEWRTGWWMRSRVRYKLAAARKREERTRNDGGDAEVRM